MEEVIVPYAQQGSLVDVRIFFDYMIKDVMAPGATEIRRVDSTTFNLKVEYGKNYEVEGITLSNQIIKKRLVCVY